MPKATATVSEINHLRPKVSRFGGMIQEGHAVMIPEQTWNGSEPLWGDKDFIARHKPELSTYGAGIPGYAGYRPHATPTRTMMFTPAEAPETAPVAPHAPDYRALDTSKQPYFMPPPGYSGHMRNTKDSHAAFGTSHWRNQTPTSRAASAAIVAQAAKQRALGLHVPKATMYGQPTSTRAEMDATKIEDNEANELLQLRSMGIRAAMKVSKMDQPM